MGSVIALTSLRIWVTVITTIFNKPFQSGSLAVLNSLEGIDVAVAEGVLGIILRTCFLGGCVLAVTGSSWSDAYGRSWSMA
jgi:hypothetical protein